MSNGSGSDDQQLWVLFREAVAWIAYRSFSGGAFGPRPLRQLPYDDVDDEEHNMGVGRCTLAEQILVDHAAKGKIQICARRVEADRPEDDDDFASAYGRVFNQGGTRDRRWRELYAPRSRRKLPTIL